MVTAYKAMTTWFNRNLRTTTIGQLEQGHRISWPTSQPERGAILSYVTFTLTMIVPETEEAPSFKAC